MTEYEELYWAERRISADRLRERDEARKERDALASQLAETGNDLAMALDSIASSDRNELLAERDAVKAEVERLRVDLKCEQIRSEDRGNSFATAQAELARLEAANKRLQIALSYAEDDEGNLPAPPMAIANVGDGHCIACGKPIEDTSFVRRYADGTVHEECP